MLKEANRLFQLLCCWWLGYSHKWAQNYHAAYVDPRAIFRVRRHYQLHITHCHRCQELLPGHRATYDQVAASCVGEAFI